MRFLTAQLNRTLIKNIIDMKDTQKCTNIRKFDFSKLIFVLSGSSLHCKVNITCNLKHVSDQNALYEKLWSLDQLYDKNLLILHNIFRMFKTSSKSM